MQEFFFIISNKDGIHARPAGMLVKESSKYVSDIRIHFKDKTADAKRIFSVMSLGVKFSDKIKLTIEGPDELLAKENMLIFFNNNL